MSSKEIEYRARLTDEQFQEIAKKLEKKLGKPKEKKRFSFMAFGETKTCTFDIRIRITNGEAEMVYKIGAFHASDRAEVPQSVEPEQMLGFIQQVAHLTDDTKLGHRRSLVFFDEEQNIEYAVVEAAPVYYLEVEKVVSAKSDIEAEQKIVLDALESLDVEALDEAGFYKITTDLNTLCDQKYNGSKNQLAEITEAIKATM